MRILFVGLGGIGQRHLRNLRTLLGTALDPIAYRVRGASAVLTDRLEIAHGEELIAKYGIREYSDLSEALDQSPEAVFVCNPSRLHVEPARQAIERGCHVFIEKPLSDRSDGVVDLVLAAEKRRVVAVVGYQLRFHPIIERARALLEAGALGRILRVHARVGEYLPDWHKYEDYRTMYAARRELGGGVILSQIHEFDYLYWLFGRPEQLFTCGGQLSELEIDVEDVASTLMQVRRGEQVFPIQLEQDYVQRPAVRTCEVLGTEGVVTIDLRTNKWQHFDKTGKVLESLLLTDFERNELFLRQTSHFLRCVAGDEQPRVPLREGAVSLIMALAARSSMESGTVVSIDAFSHSTGMGGL